MTDKLRSKLVLLVEELELSRPVFHGIVYRDLAKRIRALLAEEEPVSGRWIEYGQDKDGHLVFAVRVLGLGAKPHSPMVEAHRLTQMWTRVLRENEGFMAEVQAIPPTRSREEEPVRYFRCSDAGCKVL